MRWYRHVKEWPRDIRRGVKNLIKWFPIIWDNHDWDHVYILYVLRAKLKFMIASFTKAQFHEGWENDVAEMKKALTILERMIADDYREEADKLRYTKDWGEYAASDYEELLPGNVNTEEDKVQWSKETLEVCEMENILQHKDDVDFFILLANNMRKWWW